MQKQIILIVGLLLFTTQLKAQTTITDIDSNIYKTVRIGTQVWMAENLKTTTYSNGDTIGTTIPATLNISSESSPKYQWAYDGNETNVDVYGRLYTWYVATDSRNVCPNGWHVPTDEEWLILIEYVGGDSVAGGKLKESGITHWTSPNVGAENTCYFTALPAGDRIINGSYNLLFDYAFFWTSTSIDLNNAKALALGNQVQLIDHGRYDKKAGYSVRCIEDPLPDSAKYFGETPPGDAALIFAPDVISTAGNNEHTLSVSLDGKEIYFTRDPAERTFVVRKTDEGWSLPEQTHFNGREAIFSASGEFLLYNDGDIWELNYADNPMGEPSKVQGTINTTKHEYYAGISNNGTLYFSRIDDDYAHIYSCILQNGEYVSELPLPEEINHSGCHNYHPFISPDEDFILFNSQQNGGYGGADIYISFKNENGDWLPALNLGETVNSSLYDLCPTLSPDGKYLFFTRYNNATSEGNIYWVSTAIIDDLKEIALSTSFKETNNTQIQIFPNPATYRIQVKGIDILLNEAVYQLIDLSGRTIKQGKLNSETIDIYGIPEGIYMISLHTNEGIFTKKIVIE